jgi:hypothetical protein
MANTQIANTNHLRRVFHFIKANPFNTRRAIKVETGLTYTQISDSLLFLSTFNLIKEIKDGSGRTSYFIPHYPKLQNIDSIIDNEKVVYGV